jgi:hypothetical protein
MYYQIVFQLAQHHKYQISEIENLIPYERDLYFEMLLEYIKSVEEKNKGK